MLRICERTEEQLMDLSISQLRRWCREGRDVTARTGRKRQWGRREGEGRRDALENGVTARNGKQNKHH